MPIDKKTTLKMCILSKFVSWALAYDTASSIVNS